jgi:DNA-binding winged helix-turn-helix (wHTH) protein
MSLEPPPLGPTDIVGLRFGSFELDFRSGELRRAGILVRLQHQPFKVLSILATRSGEVVGREEIQHEVWPDDVFLGFEQSLNSCIRQIRSALNDSALHSRYIETLPKRGYRWIVPVEAIHGRSGPSVTAPAAPLQSEDGGPVPGPGIGWGGLAGAVAVALIVGTAGGIGIQRLRAREPSFRQLTHRPGVVHSARFTPDGQVVLSAEWQGSLLGFYVTSPVALGARPLGIASRHVVGVAGGDVAFLKDSTVLRAPILGGPTKELLADASDADWTADGAELAIVRRNGAVATVEYPPGTVLYSTRACANVRIDPAREHVAFVEHLTPGDDEGSVMVVDLRSRVVKVLAAHWSSVDGLAWSPRGDEVWFTAAKEGDHTALYAVSLKGRMRTVFATMGGRLILEDIARDGGVLLKRATVRGEVRVRRTPDSEEEDFSWLDCPVVTDISKDGGSLLIEQGCEEEGPEYGVYLRRMGEPASLRLGSGRGISLSPDGRWALAVPIRDPSSIELLPIGPGSPKQLRYTGIARYLFARFLPPGNSIVATAQTTDGKQRTYVVDPDGGAPRPVTPEGVLSPAIPTPLDKDHILAPWRGRYWFFSTDGREPTPVEGLAATDLPFAFTDSGRSLLVTDAPSESRPPFPMNVRRLHLATGASEPWRQIGPAETLGISDLSSILAGPTGWPYAYSYWRESSDLYLVRGLS